MMDVVVSNNTKDDELSIRVFDGDCPIANLYILGDRLILHLPTDDNKPASVSLGRTLHFVPGGHFGGILPANWRSFSWNISPKITPTMRRALAKRRLAS